MDSWPEWPASPAARLLRLVGRKAVIAFRSRLQTELLPDLERLRRSGLYQRVYTARKIVSARGISLYVLPRQSRSQPKYPLTGFVVGKKVSNRAVVRNRLKRRVREAYRLIRLESEAELNSGKDLISEIKQWYALVWVINGEEINVSFPDIKERLRDCLGRAATKYGHSANSRKTPSGGESR